MQNVVGNSYFRPALPMSWAKKLIYKYQLLLWKNFKIQTLFASVIVSMAFMIVPTNIIV